MKKHSTTAAGASELRRLAERRLKSQPAKVRRIEALADTQRLLQELQIHQIELEMQNEELKQSKAEVEAGLEKYTDLYDFAPVGYLSLDKQGSILDVNLTGASLLGTERSLLSGRRFQLFVAPADHIAFRTFLRQVFKDRSRQSGDFDLLIGDQSLRSVNIKARCLPNGMECRVVVMDITERKQAEDQMRVSEIRYRRLFEAAQDGVLLLDPNTCKITDANPFMTKLLDYQHADLVGKELFEIGLLKDEAASREMFLKLKRTRQVRYENLPLESQSGRHQEVEVVANLYEENGHSVIQCNIRDITKRKQAENVLRLNEALFSALLAQAPIGVYVVDAAFRLQQINPKAQPAFKHVPHPVGRDFAEVIHVVWPRKVASQLVARFRHTLATGESYQSPEFVAQRRDLGVKQVYEWQIQRVTLPSGEHRVVCFFNDITQRKREEGAQRRLDVMTASNAKLKQEIIRRQAVETALTQSEQRALRLLEQSRQLQKKLRQMSHQMVLVQENQRREISHELHDKISQVLIGINVQLAIFAKAVTINPKGIRRAIVPVRKLVEESVRIVHQFARELRPAMLDELGLIPALRTYIDELPKKKGRKIHFTAFSGAEDLDNDKRTVLYRVAQEALTNIIKHADARTVKVVLLKSRRGISLQVSDDGKAFEVGQLGSARWKNRLGLIGMRERVEMVGGQFSIESVPGTGTTIRAEIPSDKTRR